MATAPATSRSSAVARGVRSYVAIGDSFTCGLEGERGGRWADEVARSLPDADYANLAEIGATSAAVEESQLPEALTLEPDLISLVCGANDVLETVRPDPGLYANTLTRMLERIRREAPQADVFTITYPDLSRFVDLRPRTQARVARGTRLYNAALRSVAQRHGVVLLETAEHPGAEERENFASDGFHASPEGHRRLGRNVVQTLAERLGIEIRTTKEATA
jgi:lysophospholipase L1-like esterase